MNNDDVQTMYIWWWWAYSYMFGFIKCTEKTALKIWKSKWRRSVVSFGRGGWNRYYIHYMYYLHTFIYLFLYLNLYICIHALLSLCLSTYILYIYIYMLNKLHLCSATLAHNFVQIPENLVGSLNVSGCCMLYMCLLGVFGKHVLMHLISFSFLLFFFF